MLLRNKTCLSCFFLVKINRSRRYCLFLCLLLNLSFVVGVENQLNSVIYHTKAFFFYVLLISGVCDKTRFLGSMLLRNKTCPSCFFYVLLLGLGFCGKRCEILRFLLRCRPSRYAPLKIACLYPCFSPQPPKIN